MASTIEPNPVKQIQQRHAATEHLMQQLIETKAGESAFLRYALRVWSELVTNACSNWRMHQAFSHLQMMQ